MTVTPAQETRLLENVQGFYFDEVDSTNEMAKRYLSAGQIDRSAFIWAATQHAGKGTQGRQWVSPPGAGLYLTLVHCGLPGSQSDSQSETRTDVLPLTTLYTRAAGVACARMLSDWLGLKIHLKPVNDLYAACPETGVYKKLGGILIESIIQDNQLKALITGIGINILNVDRPLPPPDSKQHRIQPVSLEELLPAHQVSMLALPQFARTELVQELLRYLADSYHHLQKTPGWVEAQYELFQLPASAVF